MEQEITHIVTEPSGKVTRQGKKMPYKQPFDIKEDTPKAQLPVIKGWNEMQKCLIENGLMESQ